MLALLVDALQALPHSFIFQGGERLFRCERGHKGSLASPAAMPPTSFTFFSPVSFSFRVLPEFLSNTGPRTIYGLTNLAQPGAAGVGYRLRAFSRVPREPEVSAMNFLQMHSNRHHYRHHFTPAT